MHVFASISENCFLRKKKNLRILNPSFQINLTQKSGMVYYPLASETSIIVISNRWANHFLACTVNLDPNQDALLPNTACVD